MAKKKRLNIQESEMWLIDHIIKWMTKLNICQVRNSFATGTVEWFWETLMRKIWKKKEFVRY